ncbi:MAG: dephospho-CoA kinase [Negativicutes bacterium]|jgi:dephospho-CoA kinase
MSKFIGLTGGIAAGKSAVVKILCQHKIRVIDCDQLACAAVAPNSLCLNEIVKLFGSTVVNSDGNLNRKLLAQQVFSEPEKRRTLENIIHPYVEARMLAEFQEGSAHGEKLIVADVPLLFEVGWRERFDEVWLVVCDDSVRINRIMKRDGLDEAAAKMRLAAQLPQTEKTALADQIIDNNKTLADLEKRIVQLINQNNC